MPVEAWAGEHLWYVSYGSNLLAERFHTYLVGSSADGPFGEHPPTLVPALPERDIWLRIDHPLYFAGRSRRWGGSPAFVSWERGPASIARGYLVGLDQFWHLVATENAVAHVDDRIVAAQLYPGEVRRIGIPDHDGAEHRAKYDALLRLPDIDGTPAVTVTSTVARTRGTPSDTYLDVVRRGLAACPFDVDADLYLAAAVERSATMTLPTLSL